MDSKKVVFIAIVAGLFFYPLFGQEKNYQDDAFNIIGQWVRLGHSGPIGLTFHENGLVEVDFGVNGEADVVSSYVISGELIRFEDHQGLECPEVGTYLIKGNQYYAALDLVDDDCGGRIKTTMGIWIRPGFQEYLPELNERISQTGSPEDILTRARIFMAIGAADRAKADLDSYIELDQSNARVFVNRAGSRFPADLPGVIEDCNQAITLEPDNKNAYFLRGLALYETGEMEKACEDFSKAIELGFSVLRVAEYEKCKEFWQE